MPTLTELYKQSTQENKEELFILALLITQARREGNTSSARALMIDVKKSINLSVPMETDKLISPPVENVFMEGRRTAGAAPVREIPNIRNPR